MTKSIVFVFAALMAFNTAVATNVNPVNVDGDAKTVTERLTDLLEDPEFEVTQEIVATVTLVVNKDHEVIVLDVESTDENVTSFIKARLNYEKLEVGEAGDHLTLPVRIRPAV